MNQEARDVLVGAQLQGIPQARGVYKRINKKGFCAIGVLIEELIRTNKVPHKWQLIDKSNRDCRVFSYSGIIRNDLYTYYSIPFSEFDEIVQANDRKKLNFLEIARKIGVKEEAHE